jgi:hypothetical protein
MASQCSGAMHQVSILVKAQWPMDKTGHAQGPSCIQIRAYWGGRGQTGCDYTVGIDHRCAHELLAIITFISQVCFCCVSGGKLAIVSSIDDGFCQQPSWFYQG